MMKELRRVSLSEFWFILITILFIGFFVLEGFDFGVGILSRFLGKNDQEKRLYINTIGPFWDANEVWLITAGGAMFAAFPHWYATLFSGFYVPTRIYALSSDYTGGFLRISERSEEHTSELQSRGHLVCRLLLEKKKN